jgi:HD-like signal output (HDOD) protein
MVKVDKLKADMLLGDDVRDVNTRLLVKKGQRIDARHIKILKMWGITEVLVKGEAEEEGPNDAAADPQRLDKAKAITAQVFTHVDLKHPAIKEIFRLAVTFRSRGKGWNPPHLVDAPKGTAACEPFAVDLQEQIDRKEIKLPEIPAIVFELNEVIADPVASAADIAQVVNKSPSLTALLLKIVNSPFYGFPAKIDTISRAVAILGTKEVSSLALGISTITMFNGIPPRIIDMQAFLKHSLACGIVARIVAAHKNIPQTEQLFVAGLLHDLGRLIAYQNYPGRATHLLSRALKGEEPLYDIEPEFLGCRHTDIGRYLLQKWKLPLSLENNLFYHHNPSQADNQMQAAIVHLADIMTNALGLGTSGSRFVPRFDEDAWEHLNLSPGCFEAVIEQAIHQLAAIEMHLQI